MIGTRSQQIFNVRTTPPNFLRMSLRPIRFLEFSAVILELHGNVWVCVICFIIPSSGVHLSVRPCVSGRSKLLLLLAKWSDPHQTFTQCSQVGPHPRCAQRQRSPDMGNFVVALKLLLVVAKWTDHH